MLLYGGPIIRKSLRNEIRRKIVHFFLEKAVGLTILEGTETEKNTSLLIVMASADAPSVKWSKLYHTHIHNLAQDRAEGF